MPADHLTPAERSLHARIAANTRWSREDGRAGTERARAEGPGRSAYWERVVDPEGALTGAERHRRAEAAKRAHFQRMALRSAQARRSRAGSP